MLHKDTQNKLVMLAKEARARAYAPYSHFSVGAALLSKSGSVFTGCNVENASYGLSVCAERAAVFSAVAQGEHEFEALAIFTDTGKPVQPCGACLQVLAEFCDDLELVLAAPGCVTAEMLSDVFPARFML